LVFEVLANSRQKTTKQRAHPETLGLQAEILPNAPVALHENQVQKIVPLPFRNVSACLIPKELSKQNILGRNHAYFDLFAPEERHCF